MANKTYTTMSLDALKFLCSVINKTVDLPTTVISDTSVATNTTYSSYKIGLDMDNMENEIKSYVDTIIAGLNKLTKEIINDKALVVKDNVLYLYKADDDVSNNYMQMMLINGVAVELGSTQADFSDIYNKSEVDGKFAAKLDLDTLTTSFNDLKTAYDTHVGDATIHITQDEKDSYALKTEVTDELDKKANTSEIPTKVSELTNDSNFITGKMCMPVVLDIFYNQSNSVDVSTIENGIYLLSANNLYSNWDAWYVGILVKYDDNLTLNEIVSNNMVINVSGSSLTTTNRYMYGLKLFKIGYHAY